MKTGLALLVAGAVSGCQTAVGVSYGYGYSDPFYWNHYYRDDVDVDIDVNRPSRPDRPERPPIAKPKPPIAKPPSIRPPMHKPSTRPARPGGGRLR
ncbi:MULTISPECIES: hypothetical protein [Dinoroseobacter]|nr:MULTISPECIES: hypothetical protein [Dinoroseobacter]MDD9715523.1 hypothetical protein [Dinoroseobacter sp. PD6]URF48297.1 hypothetical protein M8008_08465 [Dinoroseobacter shibae]URF52607.1 hypothetical protein M8007_08465 [Dinoroseobacter shibae]